MWFALTASCRRASLPMATSTFVNLWVCRRTFHDHKEMQKDRLFALCDNFFNISLEFETALRSYQSLRNHLPEDASFSFVFVLLRNLSKFKMRPHTSSKVKHLENLVSGLSAVAISCLCFQETRPR